VCRSLVVLLKNIAPLFHAPQDQDTIPSRHCIHGLKSIPDIDRYLSMTRGLVKHVGETRVVSLLRLLAARVFQTIVAFQKKSGPGKITTGWILDSSGSIPDSMSWIPDSKVVDSGFHSLKLPGFRIPDYLTWGANIRSHY